MLKPVNSSPSPYRTLMGRLLDTPGLVQTLQALPGPRFAALVQTVGLEDAGELIAMATTEQLVSAFDEDLFRNQKPGERETFDPERFVTWLEVLLEAGEAVAARRVADLSPDFVVAALSSLVLVLDHDALLSRISEGGRAARYADKAIESSLSEEIDGYLLVARRAEGWDAALGLILALDQEHRPLLERLLDRCAELCRGYIDDLDALHDVLSAGDSLAEDVEAEREERRSRRGYVEPRAARSFLALCQQTLSSPILATPRDPISAAYFRERRIDPEPSAVTTGQAATSRADDLLTALLHEGDAPIETSARGLLGPGTSELPPGNAAAATFLAALQQLREEAPALAGSRMDELGYLANVLLAGAKSSEAGGGRLRPVAAAEAVLATVALGAEIAAYSERGGTTRKPASVAELLRVLRLCSADVLFRGACSMLAADPAWRRQIFVRTQAELATILASGPSFPSRPRSR
jgi:hypothetical protein